jgi:predicted sugar kinase
MGADVRVRRGPFREKRAVMSTTRSRLHAMSHDMRPEIGRKGFVGARFHLAGVALRAPEERLLRTHAPEQQVDAPCDGKARNGADDVPREVLPRGVTTE